MFKKTDKIYVFFGKMSALKKTLIVFASLLVFILIIELPGRFPENNKNAKFIIPKMNAETTEKISIKKTGTKEIILEKKDKKWQVKNGDYFPADTKKVNDFMEALYNLKQGSMIAKNPDNLSIYSIDAQNGIQVQVWDNKNRIADLFVGKPMANGQLIRNTSESMVFQSSPGITSFLNESADSWKDKILLNADENESMQVTLINSGKELVLEKSASGEWSVIRPKKYKADVSSVSKLFEQLKLMQAVSAEDSAESKKVDFTNPDYKISVRLKDNSLKSVLFKAAGGKKNEFYAKDGATNFIYFISSDLINKIFGLKF